MIYFIIWLVGALAVMALYSAGRANLRAEEAYQLARSGMYRHFHVAGMLVEHHERLEDIENPDVSEFAEGGTTDEQD